MKKNDAFTLVEILIALLIFAILAVIVSVGLRSSLETYQKVKVKNERFTELQVALTVMQRDVNQAVPRAITGDDGQASPALYGKAAEFDITRGGYVNPESIEKRSTLQRISYQYKNNQIIRSTFPVLDQVKTTKSAPRVLLNNVDKLTFQYVDAHNASRNFWPIVASQKNSLPRAVEVTMRVKGLGNLSRYFLVPGGVAHAKK